MENLGIEETCIKHCNCVPPGVALLQKGAFSSTPTRPPKWAFDIVLLDYILQHFAYGTPNVSAWCHASVAFLLGRGVQNVPSAASVILHIAPGIDLTKVPSECPPEASTNSFTVLSDH